ncbi:MAG TPA: PEGA domain-containing protein [Kofleriaceae bacterium]
MIRVLSSACVVLLLLALGGRAHAGSKPPIAILGLEVYDNGGGIDPETTRAAKELTAALRDRAKAGTGPYTPVQGGEKELIDEKLLNNCDSEAASCMAAIGNELGAEVLLFGKIEKVNQNGQMVYRVSLKLLQVGRKQISSAVESLPVADAGNDVKVSAAVRTWYSKLVGGTGGTLAVKASNLDRGTVLIDGEDKGNLTSGALTLQGLPEGRHTLAIEAKDYQRYEARITIRAGETTTQSVTMVEMTSSKKPVLVPSGNHISTEGTVAAKSKTNVWKPVFYGALVLDAAAASFALYEWKLSRDDAKNIPSGSKQYDESSCGTGDEANNPALQSACSHYSKRTIGWVVTGVVGAAVVGSFVMAYLRDGGSESETKAALGGHRKRRELVVTPIVTPQGGGATLQFDW